MLRGIHDGAPLPAIVTSVQTTTMNSTTITLDLPGIREYVQEHYGCDWEDAMDWFEQVSGQTVPESQWGIIEEVWEEESQNWEPTDYDMMASFGTPWHDGL